MTPADSSETSPSPLEPEGAQVSAEGEEGQQEGLTVLRHQIKQGETLLEIAAKYGVTVADVQAANNLSGTVIHAGETLSIPIPESLSENGNGNGAETISTTFNYAVRPGDTVISIAVRFGTTVAAVQEANGLGPDAIIRPGQGMRVPVSGVPSSILATSAGAPASSGQDSDRVYLPLQIVGPEDGLEIAHSEDVLFRWLSNTLLQESEWYVVYIWPLDGLYELPPPVWTKATSYRLSSQWAPPLERAVTYRWQISVVRVSADEEGGHSIEAASDPGEVRSFVWTGSGG